MTLPADVDRCHGFGLTPDDLLDECHTCQRRTLPWAGLPGGGQFIDPPKIITFFCEFFIPEDES